MDAVMIPAGADVLAMEAAVRGGLLEALDSGDGQVADGQRTIRTWLVHSTRVTRGQADEHTAVQALARSHPVLRAALAEGWVLTKSVALLLARWTRPIPAQYRAAAEEIVVAAARAGADLRALAAICAEIRSRTAPPDPDDDDDAHLDWGVSFDTTFDGAGVIHGDLAPECAAMVTKAVLDALADPAAALPRRARRSDTVVVLDVSHRVCHLRHVILGSSNRRGSCLGRW
jgi:hypothetical protein